MNFNRLFAVSAFIFVPANFAQARPQPNPPPSGIVVHLFGPNSVMSNIVPDLPGEIVKPAPSAMAAPPTLATPGQPASQPATQSASTAEPTPTAYPEPTWGDVLHQMFIVGDPDNPPKPAPGRPSERPGAQ